jgi:hypothetical protein
MDSPTAARINHVTSFITSFSGTLVDLMWSSHFRRDLKWNRGGFAGNLGCLKPQPA